MITRRLLNLYRHSYLRLPKRPLVHSGEQKGGVEKGSWREHKVEQEIQRGIDLMRDEEEDVRCLFPTITRLGVSTKDRVHTFEAHCDQLIKFIKLGAINKNIALQYCHYLAHLARTCGAADVEYFSIRCIDLLSYLMRNSKDLTIKSQVDLICDVSDTSASNCIKTCDLTIQQEELGNAFATKQLSTLLSSCYKFALWEKATELIIKYQTTKMVHPTLFDSLITMLPNSIEIYQNLSAESDDKKKFKNDMAEHLLKICELAHRDRIQFITRYTSEFIKHLESLDVKVVKNPTIKLSGRCVSCNSFIPIYNDQATTQINKSIKSVLQQRLEDKYYMHSSPKDLERFEEYLNNLYRIDRKPVDLVIDGLNIAYKNTLGVYYIKKAVSDDFEISERRQNPRSQVQVLINTIIRGCMLQNFKKILVIGREHMRHWPGLLDFFDKHRVHYYFSLNHTKDDLFQLYAATFNPKTLLVTGDFLRDHLVLLDQESRIALERWIDTHQVWIQRKTLKPVWPTTYEKVPSAQRDTDHIHIPIIDFHKLATIADHEPPPHLNGKMITWACCKLRE